MFPRALAFLGRVLVCGAATALVALPVVCEQAIERARFEDRLGTFPVEVSLSHNGSSTLDTGLVGRLYWDRTGFAGFGASVRSTGPPEAGGTLTSYVSPEFLQANAAFIDSPAAVAAVYGEELRSEVLGVVLASELVAFAVGGVLGALAFRRSPRVQVARRRLLLVRGGTVGVGLTASALLAAALFGRWDGNQPIGQTYAMPGVDKLSFSSPQTREVAEQVEPFVVKMSDRIAERTANYLDAGVASFGLEIETHADALRPRDGEKVVLAEADPQGSQVATRLRTRLYPLLQEALGEDAVILRTIAGDVSSNGAVAEETFIEREAAAFPKVPTLAVKGDHDSEATVQQLKDNDVIVSDLEVTEVEGLRVAGAADPAFKALFGGLVTNPSGKTEPELGEELRDVVDQSEESEENQVAPMVVLHQPRAVSGYLGIGVGELADVVGNETTPADDGIPDLPPGIVTYGHLHDPGGPWVIWNTDGGKVTWTVVTQLGTSGGVEENPTFNRFSTPFSVPLKNVSMNLTYLNPETGLQTGYAMISIATDGTVNVQDRVEIGLPGGLPGQQDQQTASE